MKGREATQKAGEATPRSQGIKSPIGEGEAGKGPGSAKAKAAAEDQSTESGAGDGTFPYDADPSDHAETPDEAYADIAPLLATLAQRLGKTKETVRIYDPYFCNGGVIRRLKVDACHP
jgi:hypothetical protein